MTTPQIDAEFARFQRTRAPDALAIVFDSVAPNLVLVAMHLCRHAADAEDLVQSVFLQAIRDVDRYDPARPVLPWLLGILSHRASDLRGRAYRRRERTFVPDDDAPSDRDPDTDVSRAEAMQQVAQALAGLPSSYRELLTLRLVQGLAAVDIARALGISPETVRTRIHRGLSMLRNGLPRGLMTPLVIALLTEEMLHASSGLQAVRDTVLRSAEAARAGSSAAVAGATGPWAMSAGWLQVAMLLVAVSLVCLVLSRRDAALAPAAPSPWVADPATVQVAAVADGVPEAVVTDLPDHRADDPVARRAGEPRARLVGTVVAAETQFPLAGVTLHVESAAVAPAWLDEPLVGMVGVYDLRREAAIAVTADDGTFELDVGVSAGRRLRLLYESAGRLPTVSAWHVPVADAAVPVGCVPLALGTPVEFRVTDDRGRPCAAIPIKVRRERVGASAGRADYDPLQPALATDAVGHLRLPALQPGAWTYELTTTLDGARCGAFEVPLQTAPLVVAIVLQLPPPDRRVRGRVVDEHGSPVPDVSVLVHGEEHQILARSGDDGVFVAGLPRAASVDASFHVVLAPDEMDFATLHEPQPFAVLGGEPVLTVCRVKQAALKVRVMDTVGETVVGRVVCFSVATLGGAPRMVPGGGPIEIDVKVAPSTGTPAAGATKRLIAGTCEWTDLRPGRYVINAAPALPWLPGAASTVDLAEGELRIVDLIVRRAAPVTFTAIAAESGRPLAGVDIAVGRAAMPGAVLEPKLAERRPVEVWATDPSPDTWLVLAAGRTDATGRVTLACDDAPGLEVLATATGRVATSMTLTRAEVAQVPMLAAAEIAGMVTPRTFIARYRSAARPPVMIVPRQVLPPTALPANLVQATGYPAVLLRRADSAGVDAAVCGPVAIGGDGSFHIAGIPPGRYTIDVVVALAQDPMYALARTIGPLATVELLAGEVHRCDLNLGPHLPGALAVQVSLGGFPWRGAVGFLALGTGDLWHSPARGSHDGEVASPWLPPGAYVPFACSVNEDGSTDRWFGTAIDVQPGVVVRAAVGIEPRHVQVSVVDSDARPRSGFRVTARPLDRPEMEAVATVTAITDADGHATLRNAPPGRLAIDVDAAVQPVPTPIRTSHELAADRDRIAVVRP